MILKIVFTDIKTLGYTLDLNPINKLGRVVVYDNLQDKELGAFISDANVIITNHNRLDSNSLKDANRVQLICQSGTGFNNIDVEYCKAQGIAVTNVPNYSTISVAQHTFAMLFYLISNSRYYDDYVQKGEYAKGKADIHYGQDFFELEGKTWGIIGLGAIGKKVAEYAKGFGCNILYYSTSGKNRDCNYKKVDLEELLKVSDVISIHAPLNEYTEGLIQLKELNLMKKSAILLNLGRGKIINENDLAYALDHQMITAAGLDVLEEEPIQQNNILLKIKDVNKIYITPHIAYGSVEARKRLVSIIGENIQSFLQGGMLNRVDL